MSLFPYNNSVSVNLNAFKLYGHKYLFTISACVIVSSTISHNIFSTYSFLLPHFISWFLVALYSSRLNIRTLTCNISLIGDNFGILAVIEFYDIVWIVTV